MVNLAGATGGAHTIMQQNPLGGGSDSSDDGGPRRPNPIDVHVGSRVRLRRMLLGISQEKLGELLGLTFQQVQKYEKGINRIGASRLFDMARILQVPVQFFYDELPPKEAGRERAAAGLADRPAEGYVADVGEFIASREGLELIKPFVRISDPALRRSIIDLVRSLADSSVNK